VFYDLTMASWNYRRDDDWVDLGDLSDFPPSECRLLEVAGSEIGIFNIAGKLHAVRNLCPHRGGPICKGWVTGTMLPSEPGRLQWGMEGRVLRCPWHRWEFDLETGRTVFEVDRRRLIIYPMRVTGSTVSLKLGAAEMKHLAQSARVPKEVLANGPDS
jgi:nitrite reductase/ring-hydroxylating ferredoxin subunit